MLKTTFAGRSSLALLLGLAGLLFTVVTPNAHADENDPPSRVARISYLDGSVSFQPGGQGDWGAAVKNRPVTIGDKIWVDKDSRAELQAGAASIHLGSMTALSFLNLDDTTTQMRLAEGSINFRVRELREGDIYEVDTPNLAFTVKQAGAFRIDVSENGDGTRITVIRGEGMVTAGGKTYDLNPGERSEFNGTDDQIQYSTSAAPAPDGLDRWANERDLKEDNSISGKYVNRDTVGYSDLDDYGTWSEVPDYGAVWYPTVVDVGWAPYSYGYWGWVAPWGWTWIDYAPWGFAPFHYGRWAFIGGRWGWCPGPIYARPFYGPAFVGFFGGSFGAGFGFGFGGGIGWFPLGWGEPFHPWFHCGPRFIERINVRNTFIRNTTIINNNHFNYAYARNARAVTVASRSAFASGQMINRGAFHLTDASLRGAQIMRNPGISPTRGSTFGAANLNRSVSMPPRAVQNRPVMARLAPAGAASHMPVQRINTRNLSPAPAGNRPGGNMVSRGAFAANAGGNTAPRSNEMSRPGARSFNDRPPSARPNVNARTNGEANSQIRGSGVRSWEGQGAAANAGRSADRPGNAGPNSQMRPSGTRTWAAQGNTTDRGRAPLGFGQNRPNDVERNASMQRNDRPPWAANAQMNGGRNAAPQAGRQPRMNSEFNRQGYANQGRGEAQPRSYAQQPREYNPPPRTYSAPNRGYPAPSRSYSEPNRGYSAPPRSYSAPSRSYSAPSRSYSAPSRGYSGGGRPSGGGGHPHR